MHSKAASPMPDRSPMGAVHRYETEIETIGRLIGGYIRRNVVHPPDTAATAGIEFPLIFAITTPETLPRCAGIARWSVRLRVGAHSRKATRKHCLIASLAAKLTGRDPKRFSKLSGHVGCISEPTVGRNRIEFQIGFDKKLLHASHSHVADLR